MESSQAAVAALIALLDPNVGAAKAGPKNVPGTIIGTSLINCDFWDPKNGFFLMGFPMWLPDNIYIYI